MRGSRMLGAVMVPAAGAGILLASTTSSTAPQPTSFAGVQARVGFTVYQPTQTYGLHRTGFALDRA